MSDSYGSLYAKSANKVSFNPSDNQRIYTLIKVDGLGRPIYTAKSGYMAYTDQVGGDVGWNVSGAVSYDEKGRIVKQGRPSFQASSLDRFPYAPRLETLFITQTSYDALDRPTKTIYPSKNWGNVYSSYQYRIDGNRALSILSDPQGRITETRENTRGQIEDIRKKYKGDTLAHMLYEYSPLGELLKAIQGDTSISDYSAKFTYDMRGLQVSRESPETGIINYKYDKRGNLIERDNPKLRTKKKVIRHHYDGFGRPKRTEYPESEDVRYFYGDSSASIRRINGVGRLIRRSDESGSIEFEYGKLGEVTSERRSLHSQRAGKPDQIALMSFKSDYLGRMNQIVYPDGEKIDYLYNPGGQLTRVRSTRFDDSSKKRAFEKVLVERIGYDEYGQRTFIDFGNGVRTDYSYDPYRRWLEGLESENKRGRTLQDLSYTFDLVGNVLSRSSTSYHASSTHSYEYDGLYQLSSAEGEYQRYPDVFSEDTGWQRSYSQEYSYDKFFNMSRKVSSEKSSSDAPVTDEPDQFDYELDYIYDTAKPHQAIRIGDYYFSYDENGNVISESNRPLKAIEKAERIGDVRVIDRAWGMEDAKASSNEKPLHLREFSWSEDNRLRSVITNSKKAVNQRVSFLYDAGGERTSKLGVNGETLYFNSWF